MRARQAEMAEAARRAFATGDAEHGFVYTGQSAGLIDGIEPAAAVVERIVAEATALLRERAPSLLAAV